MGVCSSATRSTEITFVFDKKYFKIDRDVQNVPFPLPVSQLFKLLKPKLSKPGSKLKLLIKVHKKVYTSKSSLTIGDLTGSKKNKFFVSAKPQDDISFNVKCMIKCCKTGETLLKLGKVTNFSQISQQIMSAKRCCGQNLSRIVINDLILDETDMVSLKANDQIYAVFSDSDLDSIPSSWSLKKNGLNLRSICYNPECQVYKQEIFIKKLFGTFVRQDLYKEEHKCPFCEATLRLKKAISFINCQVTVRDLKTGNDFKITFGDHIEEFLVPLNMHADVLEIVKLIEI